MNLGRFVFISLLAFSLSGPTAIAADTPSAPADQMSGREKVALEVSRPILLQGPSNGDAAGFEAVFENGAQVTLVDWLDKKERCFFTVRLNDADFIEALDTGKYPVYVLKPGFMKLFQREIAGDLRLGDDTHFRVTGVRFAINWQENAPGSNYYIAAGAPLSRQDGKPTTSRVVGLGCEGNDLRWSDLNRAFGADTMNIYGLIKL